MRKRSRKELAAIHAKGGRGGGIRDRELSGENTQNPSEGYEIMVTEKGKTQSLDFLQGKKYKRKYMNKDRADEEIKEVLKTNPWLKDQVTFKTQPYKVDKRNKKTMVVK